MSRYTTGEIAKLCGVTVRTVQYYDTRNILVPSELSEGGRRLYSDDDVKKMKTICFLRDVGISINSIGELFSEENPGSVIAALIDQHEEVLREELNERKKKLDMLEQIRRELKNIEHFSVESIGDIAYSMENKKKMRKLHALMLITGIPIEIAEWWAIFYWVTTGNFVPTLLHLCAAVVYVVWITRYYFSRVVYICPECHSIFKPTFKEAFFARHTPTLRKLTCTCCGYKGFCVETYKREEEKK